jgi:hypothetical protein
LIANCYIGQVLYVLGLLLVGKERKQVQKELAQLQLIPKLSNLFDRSVTIQICVPLFVQDLNIHIRFVPFQADL